MINYCEIVSKSFGYIAILCLTYCHWFCCFDGRTQIRFWKKKLEKENIDQVIHRFHYVN